MKTLNGIGVKRNTVRCLYSSRLHNELDFPKQALATRRDMDAQGRARL